MNENENWAEWKKLTRKRENRSLNRKKWGNVETVFSCWKEEMEVLNMTFSFDVGGSYVSGTKRKTKLWVLTWLADNYDLHQMRENRNKNPVLVILHLLLLIANLTRHEGGTHAQHVDLGMLVRLLSIFVCGLVPWALLRARDLLWCSSICWINLGRYL